MIENFLTISFLTIIFCTLACSMMGNLVLWKRISFYGDAVSHSALLGFTLGAFLEINQIIILIIFNLFFATLVNILSKQKDNLIFLTQKAPDVEGPKQLINVKRRKTKVKLNDLRKEIDLNLKLYGLNLKQEE
jgi:hypothetical protein